MAPKKQVVGTVDIPLKDYLELVKADELVVKKKERLTDILEQLEIFLSFMATQEFFREAMKQFNNQSTVCEIKLIDDRVKIDLPE